MMSVETVQCRTSGNSCPRLNTQAWSRHRCHNHNNR